MRGRVIACAFVLAGCTEARAPERVAKLTLPDALAGSPTTPGPAPRMRAFDAVEVNATCERCHVDIAEEWRSSLHRRAHGDAAYQTQFVKEPLPFCTGCHAPEADPEAAVAPGVSELGVGCVTCHVVGGDILAAPSGLAPPNRHHDVRRSVAFASVDACASCHEFSFPSRQDRGLMMQETVSEHAASSFADRSCASCHMPLTDGAHDGEHRSHRFAASRDDEALRRAVDVRVSLREQTLRFTLTPRDIGHAFPTGDMLRRIALRVVVRDAGGDIVGEHEHVFARHFGFERKRGKPLRRVLVADNRLGVDGASTAHVHRLRSAPAGGSVDYSVRYERVLEPGEAESPGTLLSSGRISL